MRGSCHTSTATPSHMHVNAAAMAREQEMQEQTCVKSGGVPATHGSVVVVVIDAAVAVGVVVAVLSKVVGRIAAAPAHEHSHGQVGCHSRCGVSETWKAARCMVAAAVLASLIGCIAGASAYDML